jgi:hypothetical protein
VSTSGLDRCACKRGFFTLRDCENAATTTCSLCSRRVCDEHLAPRIDTKVCVECAARQEEGGTPGAYGAVAGAAGPQPGGPGAAAHQPGLGPPLERLDPTEGAVRWRTRYYRNYGYEPMWWGTYDPYWNDWGYRSYDDDDDDDDGGFGDS